MNDKKTETTITITVKQEGKVNENEDLPVAVDISHEDCGNKRLDETADFLAKAIHEFLNQVMDFANRGQNDEKNSSDL